MFDQKWSKEDAYACQAIPNLAQAQVSSSRTPSWTMSTSRTRSQRSSSCPMLLLDSAKPCCQSTPKICAFNPNQMNQSSQSEWKYEGFVVRTPTWAISETQGSRFASHTFVKKCCMANSGVLLKGKWRMCTGTTQPSKGVSLFGKVPSLTSCSHNFWKPMSVPYMFSCGSFCGGAYLINYSAWQVTNKILLETIHRIGKVLQSDTGYPLKKPTTLQLKGKNLRHTTSNHSLSFD